MKLSACLLFAFLVSLAGRQALACKCAAPPPPKEAMEKAAAVFSGKVVRLVRDPDGGEVKVTVEVERIWKGVDEKTAVVSTASNDGACGFGFKEGESYLVYAFRQDDRLGTNLCTRTKALSQAKEDLAELGEGKPAQPPKLRPIE